MKGEGNQEREQFCGLGDQRNLQRPQDLCRVIGAQRKAE